MSEYFLSFDCDCVLLNADPLLFLNAKKTKTGKKSILCAIIQINFVYSTKYVVSLVIGAVTIGPRRHRVVQ